jgi:hypothetical protein
MASEPNAPRSRRALLTAAAGGAAAMAATAAMPLTTLAADGDSIVIGATDNAGTSETTLTQATDGEVGLRIVNTVAGAAAVIGTVGDQTNIATNTSWTGVYGFSPASTELGVLATGVWGDSEDIGTYGFGSIGVAGDGAIGVLGRADTGGIGVSARNFDVTQVALQVVGKVTFSRSGRATIGTGKSSVKVTLPGTSTSSRVFAVLHSNRSGRYVRAVVPTTGSFTIYLNTTVTSSTYVAWFVIN